MPEAPSIKNRRLRSTPLPGWRGIHEITLTTEDEVFDKPVSVQAVDAGNIRYEDSEGLVHDVTLAAGDTILGPAGGFVYVQKIIAGAHTTINEIIAGIT